MLTKNPFEGKSEVNIVFLGGSITEGAHSSEKKYSYFGIVSEWLKEQFPEQNVNCHNAGIGGTGSNFGMVRMDKDVLCHKPDMLFVEFAVNDAGMDRRAYMESIIRKTFALDEVPYIVFLYTANKQYTTVTSYHEQVAAYYGIPEIDLQTALKVTLDGKDPVELGMFKDNVHPLDGGFRIYSDTIISRLSMDSAFVRPVKKPPMLKETFLIDAEFTPSTKVCHTDGWDERTAHRGYECLLTDKVGENISFEFDGNFFAFESGLHKDSGILDVYIDGELFKSESSYYPNFTSFQCVFKEMSYDLPMGHHKVEMVLREESCPEHRGSIYMVYHIITGTATPAK